MRFHKQKVLAIVLVVLATLLLAYLIKHAVQPPPDCLVDPDNPACRVQE